MSRLDDPREKDIPTIYWSDVFREYALLQAVREVAVQLSAIAATLDLINHKLKTQL